MTSVRGKRTIEVQPVQRGFSSSSAYQDDSLTDLAIAWNNISAAKRVLYRAETRASDAALPLSSQATHERHKRRVRSAQPHQRVFSPPIGRDEQVLDRASNLQESENYREVRRSLLRKLKQKGNDYFDEPNHYKGKPQSYRSPTADKLYPSVHFAKDTSRDILDRGSTNLSLDNSTQVRVLNDTPSQTFVSRPREPTVEVSPGLKVNRDYIPAYDRLYGNYGRDFPASSQADHGRLNYGAAHDRHQIHLAPTGYERLRQKVESQKNDLHSRRTGSSDVLRRPHHRETDPVVYMQNGPNGLPGDEYITAPVRKIARAPQAPHYKGFNIPQTHYKLPDGRIVSEESLPRKQNKKREQKHRSAPKEEELHVKPLQPSKSQSDNNQNKPTRKVKHKKASSSSKKEKHIETKESVSAYAWREGQKVVRDALGPLKVNKEKFAHSPPTKDENPSSVNSDSLGSVGEEKESPREDGGKEETSGPRRGMDSIDADDKGVNPVNDRLPSAARDVLDDLHLDSDKESKEDEDGKDEPAEMRQPLSFIVDPGQRKPPPGKSKNNSENDVTTAPATKVRHYDSREVRKYMMLQKSKRKKKQQEQEQKKKDAEMKKQKQLEELYKKQKDNAKVIPKDNIQGKGNEKQLDKTFSKEPEPRHVQPVAVEGRRPPPKAHTMRRLDVTSSDKENKAFWSTSSSDTSSRSSPQTDISGQGGEMAAGTHPANTEVRGGDIVLIPVTEEGAPISVVGVQKIPSPSQEIGTTKQKTEMTSSLAVADNASKDPPVTGEQPGKQDRLQALKATAAALQSRLDSEVKKFASDLSSLLPTVRQPVPESGTVPLHNEIDEDQRLLNHQLNIPQSRRIERPLSPRQLTWHNELGGRHGERWAFTVPTPGTKPSVRFEDEDNNQKSPFQTKQQRILGSEEQNQVFTGILPGVQSITQQAALGLERKKQDRAATLIQASYRGHQVRQQLKWAAPKPSTRADHQREQFLVGLEGIEEHLTLSEGALSDDSANAEVEEDYLPKFQSLRASPHQHVLEPTPSSAKPSKDVSPEILSSMFRTPSAFEPTNDGLSVIDIFTRRYQQAQRSLIASRSKPQSSKTKSLANDRQVSPQPDLSSPHSSLRRPTTLEYSDDEFHSISSRTKSSVAASKGRSRSQNVSEVTDPPYTPDFTEASKSPLSGGKEMSSVEKGFSGGSRTSVEARNTSLPSGSLSPPSKKLPVSSQPSSPVTTASISAVLQSEDEALDSPEKSPGDPASNSLAHPLASDNLPKKIVANSPCSLPLSPTNEKPKLSKSPMSDPGHQEVRQSPLGSNVYSSSDEEVPRSVRSRKRRGRKSPSSKKSPLSPVGQTNFRPISSPVAPSAPNAGPSEKPPLIPSMVGYSPSALQLKMASELNLLDMLDASSQQVAEMEHARTMALAHEESAALARILEVRQKEHEKELQLLSMKAKQEVEEANRQLEEVRQKVASTTLETEKVLMKSKLDAAESRKEAADRLLQTQAEASRITAEAAKQLAEAHNAAASKPPIGPADPSKLAAESVQAAVTAALEQQRLHQLEMLKEMRSGFKSPPPPRRSLGVGVNLPQRSPGQGPSRSPTPHYTEDFMHSTSTAQSTASQSKLPSSKSSSSPGDSINTSEGLKSSQSKGSSVPESIQSDTSLAKTPERVSRYSLQSVESENDSSIHTDSGARKASNDTASIISEKLDDTKSISDDYSISFEESASEVESVVDTSDRAVSQSKKSTDQNKSSQRPSSRQAVTTETRQDTGRASNLPVNGMHDTTLISPTPPYQMSVDYIKQQLEEEVVRSKQQMALLSLREKALNDKTQAELQWLEHQKKQVKDNRDTEGLEIVRRRQKDLVTKMNKEKEEIALLREAQIAASHKRRMLLQQQEGIIKLQQSTQRIKARTRNLTPISPHLTSFESHVSHDSIEGPKVTSLGSSYTHSRDDDFGVNDLGITREPNSTLELSPAEKQMRALQKVKLSARGLSKRAVNLKKRRKEAEELLAWKQKLDQEEEEVVKLEKQVKTILKVKPGKSQEKVVSPLPQHHKQSSPKVPSEKDETPSSKSQISERVDSVCSGKRLDSLSSGTSEQSRTKSKSSISSKVKSKSTENSVPEELSAASSITEEIETSKSETKSKKSPSRSPNRNSSSDETVKDASLLGDYANESFDSVDHTVTPIKSVSPSPSRTTSSMKPSPVFSPLSPSKRKQESESGSESERSLSQTFSETASDQSDIEGRIRALTDSLKKRKIEADKLRKQQKRLYREKLKAQEASLKKQLETYDSFINQTRKDLVKEMDTHVPSVISGAKPQIKHLSISETQRKRDQSHTRALRQRTASESSVEGSVEIPKKRGHGFAEKRSSRSSVDDDPVSSIKDVKQSQEDESKKPSELPTRSRSLSGDSSITEDLSLKSLEEPSLSETSPSVSHKSHDKIPEENEHVPEKESVTPQDQGKSPDSDVLPETSKSQRENREETIEAVKEDTDADKSEKLIEQHPESSEIPEEISSALSEASSKSAASARRTLDFPPKETSDNLDDGKTSDVSIKSSREGKSPSLSSGITDQENKDEQLPMQSPRTESRSSSKQSHTPRTDPSYSEDFQESSVSIPIKESKSDTEDDISEHLSDRSAASGESQLSEKFVSRPQDEPDEVQVAAVVSENNNRITPGHSHQGEERMLEPTAEVTVSPRISEEEPVRLSPEAVVDVSERKDELETDLLPNLLVGCRVVTEGDKHGILRYKGSMKSKDGFWVGVELDEPVGNNDGTVDGTEYFSCAINCGLFVSSNKVKEEEEEGNLSRASSVEEEIPSQSSISVKVDSCDKSGSSLKFTEEFPAGANTDDEESIAEEISEGVTDDAALQKVIISTAEAVESFSFDRDEPEGGESSPHDTPRGPPEESAPEIPTPKPEVVEKIASDLIEEVVVESVKTMVGVLERQKSYEDRTEEPEEAGKQKPSSFLELITPSEEDGAVVAPSSPSLPSVDGEQEALDKKEQVVKDEVEVILKSVVQQTIDEMIKVMEAKEEKWKSSEPKDKPSVDEPLSPKTPEKGDSLLDVVKISTPYTPDSDRTTPGDDLDSPLPDELFINRVKVESAISGIRDGDDTTPRARPTSPIFGESGSINPQALSDKLEQLQALDQDIFGADLFGGQEWFDDDFGSMPKSNSIIKVPRRAADDSAIPSRSPSPEEPLPKYNEARHVELKKLVEEPFMAVPHNKKDVTALMKKAVTVVHEKAEQGNSLDSLTPMQSFLGSDTIGSDIESTSKKAYKHLLFDLAKETYQAVVSEQEPVIQPLWMKPKRRPRKFLFQDVPKSLEEMNAAVNSEATKTLGLSPMNSGEAFNKYTIKKKRDKVDEILIQELREEEQEWVDYDDDELSVKMQLTESIFTSLLSETASVFKRIHESRLGRENPSTLSDSDIEF